MPGSQRHMSMPPPDPLMEWTHRAADIPERGLDTTRAAREDELAALTVALDIPACRHLGLAYSLRPLGKGRYRLTGEMTAGVTQSCIVTLEPVEAEVRETVDEEFWPEEDITPDIPGAEGDEREALSHTAPEPIRQGVIDVGRLVYEQLATSLDPYPRSPNAAFSWNEADDQAAPGRDTPFAALAALKHKEPKE